MKKLISISLISLVILIINSCSKVEGQGGTSTIKGKINVKKYNTVGTLIAEYDGADVDVYIIYGSGKTFYNDDVKTSYDGTFEFNYLENGNYTIFVYEDCNTCGSGKSVILNEATITSKHSEVDLGTIDIKNL